MGDIVRRGKLILDLVAGKQELEAPDVKELLAAKDQQIQLEEKLTAAVKDADEAQKALGKTEEQQEVPRGRAIRQLFEQSQALQKLVSGSFQVARSLALMGASSEDSLNRMVRDLAAVQAGMDLFKGTTNIMRGLSSVLNLTAASTAALMRVANPLVAVASLVGSAFLVWKGRAAETRAEEERLAQAVRDRTDALRSAQEAARRSLERLQRGRIDDLPPEQRAAAIERLQKQKEEEAFQQGLRAQNTGQTAVQQQEQLEKFYDLKREAEEMARDVRRIRSEAAEDAKKSFDDFFEAVARTSRSAIDALTGQEKKMTKFEMALQALTPK